MVRTLVKHVESHHSNRRKPETVYKHLFKLAGFLGLACLAAFHGCGKSSKKQDATVQGTVTIDGELVNRGTVAFHPVGGGPGAYGTIYKDGTFALRIGQGNPGNQDQSLIYSGDYLASVVVRAPSTTDKKLGASAPPTPGVLLSAAKYSNKATSELKFTIKPGLNVVDIPLEGFVSKEILEDSTEEQVDLTEGNVAPESQNESSAETDEPEESNGMDASAEESEL